MGLILLLDLDDTLLNNDIDRFLPYYLKALSKHLEGQFPGEKMVKELLGATQLMLQNENPALTLEEVFDQAFYPALGTSKAAMQEAIDSFYENVFPTLQPLTSPRPEAVRLVESAFARGYTVVVATNPLFPRRAIQHRLAWAGLPMDQYPFALVTSYEGFHFTKPHPAYFAEILGQLGWPNSPAVMVGNSLPDDIRPASALGLPTFWLNGSGEDGDHNPLSAFGKMEDILDWMERVAAEESQEIPATRTALLGMLESTPAAFGSMTRAMPASAWTTQPAPGEWSVTQVLCHLRDVDREVNCPRLETVSREDNPFLPGINTDLWAEERNYAAQNGPEALQEFVETRSQLLGLLKSLPAEDWKRPARHAIFGPTTVTELVSFIATHDRTHLQQVCANVNGSTDREM